MTFGPECASGTLADAERVGSIIEAGMRALGMTGEISVWAGRASHTRWVGKANDHDVIIDVKILPRGSA